MSSFPAIVADHVSKFYGPFAATQDVTFTVPAGQVVALLGPNGAGKSTTMKILTGFMTPSTGRVQIGGHDVRTHPLAAAAVVGYLPENGPLYADMTPRQMLRFSGHARGLSTGTFGERLEGVAVRCDISNILDTPTGKLSKGLRQRVGLAIALLHDPAVLIMDEPTAGLDPNQIREFRHLVSQLKGTKTLLISTHILQEVPALAERILLLHAGRLVFDGTPDAMSGAGSLEDAFCRMTDGVDRES